MRTKTTAMIVGVVGAVLSLWSGKARAEADGQALAFPTWGNGEYLVVWEHEHSPGDVDIHARRYSARGEPEAGVFAIASSSSNETNPRVAHNWTTNELLVVWEHEHAPGDVDLHARRLSADGSRLGPLLVVASSGESEVEPEVGYSALHDEYLVTWSAMGPRGAGARRARLLASDGAGASGAFAWDEGCAEHLPRSWVVSPPVRIPRLPPRGGEPPVPAGGSWVADIPLPIPDTEDRVASSPVPQPVPDGFVSATPITLPSTDLVSATPIPLPHPATLVVATPIPVTDPSTWERRVYVEIGDPSGLLSSLPLPIPGPRSWMAVSSLPLPAD